MRNSGGVRCIRVPSRHTCTVSILILNPGVRNSPMGIWTMRTRPGLTKDNQVLVLHDFEPLAPALLLKPSPWAVPAVPLQQLHTLPDTSPHNPIAQLGPRSALNQVLNNDRHGTTGPKASDELAVDPS